MTIQHPLSGGRHAPHGQHEAAQGAVASNDAGALLFQSTDEMRDVDMVLHATSLQTFRPREPAIRVWSGPEKWRAIAALCLSLLLIGVGVGFFSLGVRGVYAGHLPIVLAGAASALGAVLGYVGPRMAITSVLRTRRLEKRVEAYLSTPEFRLYLAHIRDQEGDVQRFQQEDVSAIEPDKAQKAS